MKFKWSIRILTLGILVLGLAACTTNQTDTAELVDPLPSWNEGETKEAILSFVDAVTNKQSGEFVAVPDRIAVFDNDGNLWSEQPAYFQLFFAIDKVKTMAADHPEWLSQQPFQSILEDDLKTFASFGEHGILEVVMATHAGNTTEEFVIGDNGTEISL
jgi:hypothetical protein